MPDYGKYSASATPRSAIIGTLADLAAKARDKTGLAGRIVFGQAPEALDNLSYGDSPLSGSGMTTRLDPKVMDIVGLLPFAATTKVSKLSRLRGFKNLREAEEAFKLATGDTIAKAKAVLGGEALRANMGMPAKASRYTEEQLKLLQIADELQKRSNYLYHTTPASNLESIRAQGLLPTAAKRFPGVSSQGKSSLAANQEVANYFGGPDYVMLRTAKGFRPANLETDLLAGGSGAYTTTDIIPPDMLEQLVSGKWLPLVGK